MFLWGLLPMDQQSTNLRKSKKLGLYDYVDPKRVIVSQATGFQKPEKGNLQPRS